MSLNPPSKRRQPSLTSLQTGANIPSPLSGAAGSPPPFASAGSPPPQSSLNGSSHHPPPAKRARSSLSISGPGSLAAHPLRNASFSATGTGPARASRSPSVDSSVVSGALTATTSGRKRGGISRSASVLTGKGGAGLGAGANGAGGAGNTAANGEQDDDDEDEEDDAADGEAVMLAGQDGAGSGMPDDEYNRWRVGILIDSLTPDQYDRYTLYTRSTLNKPAIRKLANQVLNQSTTPMVVTTIAGYTKIFVVEIIERAREVARQWGRENQPLGPDEIREAWRRWLRDGEGGGVVERSSGGGRALFR